jgi:hypothetical protein
MVGPPRPRRQGAIASRQQPARGASRASRRMPGGPRPLPRWRQPNAQWARAWRRSAGPLPALRRPRRGFRRWSRERPCGQLQGWWRSWLPVSDAVPEGAPGGALGRMRVPLRTRNDSPCGGSGILWITPDHNASHVGDALYVASYMPIGYYMWFLGPAPRLPVNWPTPEERRVRGSSADQAEIVGSQGEDPTPEGKPYGEVPGGVPARRRRPIAE